MPKEHHFDLLNNSISYFQEAVDYAQRETTETQHWKFAVINVVQAMELAFKEFLRRRHPIFIWSSVDKPDKTVSFGLAIERLRNPAIGGVSISDAEIKKIKKAIELRNELTHYQFDYDHDYIELKFAELFSFMLFFYKAHLELEPHEYIDDSQHRKIINLVKARHELLSRAKDYIKQNTVTVWVCPACLENTFLVEENRCCFCLHNEEIVECENCKEAIFASKVIDVTQYFELSYDEGITRIENDFGAPHTACPECLSVVRDGIDELRMMRYYEDQVEEEDYSFGS